jgi:integrase
VNIPYIAKIRARGQDYYYYRRDGQRIRIHGEPGSEAFNARYSDIHRSFEAPDNHGSDVRTIPGSLAALIVAYKKSPDFTQLAEKTRKDYRRYLDRMSNDIGKALIRHIERKHVLSYRDRFADKPRTANYYMQVMRLLFTWAIDHGWMKQNPALRPKRLKTGEGHRPWEEWEIDAYRAKWSVDTVERVAFELLINTGQRSGDIAKMTRQQAYKGEISVAQEKTAERLWIPKSNDLRAVLDPWLESHGHVVILTTETGRPFKIDYFRRVMREARVAAGLPTDLTSHGLRYTAARILKELGCDTETIQSITGHRTEQMARKYSDKKRRSKVAINRLNQARSEQK